MLHEIPLDAEACSVTAFCLSSRSPRTLLFSVVHMLTIGVVEWMWFFKELILFSHDLGSIGKPADAVSLNSFCLPWHAIIQRRLVSIYFRFQSWPCWLLNETGYIGRICGNEV